MTQVLVANRGEIAVRVIRACKELGLHTVVSRTCDADARHLLLRLMDMIQPRTGWKELRISAADAEGS